MIETAAFLLAFLTSDHPAYEPHRAEVLEFVSTGWQQELVGFAKAAAQYSPSDLDLSCDDPRAEILIGLPVPKPSGGWAAPIGVRVSTAEAFDTTCSVVHDEQLLGSVDITVENCTECEWPEP